MLEIFWDWSEKILRNSIIYCDSEKKNFKNNLEKFK